MENKYLESRCTILHDLYVLKLTPTFIQIGKTGPNEQTESGTNHLILRRNTCTRIRDKYTSYIDIADGGNGATVVDCGLDLQQIIQAIQYAPSL